MVAIENFNGITSLRKDGSLWYFILIAGDNAMVADHNTDLVNALDANYRTIPEKDAGLALMARGALAMSLAAIRQAELLDEHLAVHGEGTVTEDELKLIVAPSP